MEKVTETLIELVISKYLTFSKSFNTESLSKSDDLKNEVLSFYLFFAVDGIQKSGFENDFIDEFMANFYKVLSKDKLFADMDSLKSFERYTRTKWPIFYKYLGEDDLIKRDYETKQFLKLIARESFYLDCLMSKSSKDIQFDSEEMFTDPSDKLPNINKELSISVDEINVQTASLLSLTNKEGQ